MTGALTTNTTYSVTVNVAPPATVKATVTTPGPIWQGQSVQAGGADIGS